MIGAQPGTPFIVTLGWMSDMSRANLRRDDESKPVRRRRDPSNLRTENEGRQPWSSAGKPDALDPLNDFDDLEVLDDDFEDEDDFDEDDFEDEDEDDFDEDDFDDEDDLG